MIAKPTDMTCPECGSPFVKRCNVQRFCSTLCCHRHRKGVGKGTAKRAHCFDGTAPDSLAGQFADMPLSKLRKEWCEAIVFEFLGEPGMEGRMRELCNALCVVKSRLLDQPP